METLKRYKELRLGQLRAFCACVQHKSYSAAARALDASQPSVWQQVRALERDFGAVLFQRRGRVLEPTYDGRIFFELAGGLLAGMDTLRTTFEDRRQGTQSSLVVAGSDALFNQEMAPVVGEFCHQFPNIQLSLITRHNAEIQELVARGEVELAVIPHGPLPTKHPLVVTETLCERRWHLVTPLAHPLSRQRRIQAADLVRYPWVLSDSESSFWSNEVRAVLGRAGVLEQLRLALRIDNSMTACRYVALGLGVTVTPYYPRGLEGASLYTRPLDRLFAPDHLVVWWRRGALPRPAARLFIDFVRRRMSRAGPSKSKVV
jgi:DNA-binding transcriptional LysR family regulator